MTSLYRIRAVEGDDELNALTLDELHWATFINEAPAIKPLEGGDWWLAELNGKPVGFASMHPAASDPPGGYLSRCGVLPAHRGNGLQLRLIRAREAQARRYGYRHTYTDTTNDNPASSNTLIRAGYRLFTPEAPWGLRNSIYWNREI